MAGRDLSTRESAFFSAYLAALRAAKIPAILLRNYERFPAHIGNDVDLFVPRAGLAVAETLFVQELRAAGGRLIVENRSDYFLDLRFTIGGSVAEVLHLDLYHGAGTWHGWHFLSESELISGAREERGFLIPRPAHEALLLCFASILWGGFFKERYQPRLAELLAPPEERAEFERCIGHAFGKRGRLSFDPASPVLPGKKPVAAYARRARRGLALQSLKRASLTALGRWVRHWGAEFARVFHPVGLHVVVLGPDGVGKSTVLRGMRERLDGLFVDTHEFHWRPAVLPDIGVAMKQRTASAGPVSEPHAKPPHPWPIALARLAYYWLDYWLGWPTRILRRRAQKHLVLFDRYADDMALDPRRYRFALPGWLLRLGAATTPRPDQTFVLLVEAGLLAARKGEVSGEQAQALLARYSAFAQGNRRRRAVDNSRPLTQVLDQIEAVIVEHLMLHGIHSPQLRLANQPGVDAK